MSPDELTPELTAVPIRWVLVRDPLGRFAPQSFLCTELCATPDRPMVLPMLGSRSYSKRHSS